jgi:CRP-like cAMP-binding protein
MHVCYQRATEAIESFGKSEFRTVLFLRDCLPSLVKKKKEL